MLTPAEARNRSIPFRKKKYRPPGPDPKVRLLGAGRAVSANLQDGEPVSNDQAAAAALPSPAPEGPDATLTEVLFEYMWDDAF